MEATKQRTKTIDDFVHCVEDVETPANTLQQAVLHRTVNTFKWSVSAKILTTLECRADFKHLLDTTIVIPSIGSYEYDFNHIFKYPNDLLDYVVLVEVSYTHNDMIMIGVKDKQYYQIIVQMNLFDSPIAYKMNIDEYIEMN